MNRLLTEGRQAVLRRVSGIQRGAECARYEPLLSALADGEASREELSILRPHMRTCLSCRARLREFRATPEREAADPALAAPNSRLRRVVPMQQEGHDSRTRKSGHLRELGRNARVA